MASHHEHVHHVLHPEDDNKMRFIHKKHALYPYLKDTEVEAAYDNKMRFIHKKQALSPFLKNADVETIYSQVYVTEARYATTTTNVKATSSSVPSGEAAYASAKAAANSPDSPAAAASSTTSLNTKPIQRTRTHSAETHTHSSETSLKTTPPQFTRSTAHNGVVKGTPHTTSRGPTVVKGTPLSASNTSSPDFISQKSDGMTAGGKAGLAFGIILAIALCGGLIFFCWRRRNNKLNKAGAERFDEKHASTNSFFGGTAAAVGSPAGDARGSIQSEKSLRSTRTASTAPRLSLRPVTQFLPNIMESRKSTGNALDVPAMSEKPSSGWHRTPKGVSQNPFDDAAVIDEKQARPVSPVNPFEEGDGVVAGATGTSGKSTPSHSQKNSWEGSEPPTPKSTKFGTAAAVPITAAGAANQAARGPNNVHRVQLEFKPSMDDELGLGAGQLVRMLHEYDDGWCLCMRMDRSQQGVCPRTCLSKLPVKPRPQGPPPQNGPPGRPMGPPPPGMRRPASPAMNNGSMVPRPLTPTGRDRAATLGRNSPSPNGSINRPRSQSMSGAGQRPVSPVGVPSRKPVPGQAL